MIQRAITAIIGVVIGLFATFAVFSAILGGLDSFYLLTQDACNYGSLNSPKRILRIAPENPEHPRDADEIDWSRDGLDLTHDGSGGCVVDGGADATLVYLSPTGERVDLAGGSATTTTVTVTVISSTTYSSIPGVMAAPPGISHRMSTRLLSDLDLSAASPDADIWMDNTIGAFVNASGGTDTAYIFNLGADSPTHSVVLNENYEYGYGMAYNEAGGHIYVLPEASNSLHRYTIGTDYSYNDVYLHGGDDYRQGIDLHGSSLFAVRGDAGNLYLDKFLINGNNRESFFLGDPTGDRAPGVLGITIADDGALLLMDRYERKLHISPDYTVATRGRVEISLNAAPLSSSALGVTEFSHGISVAPNDSLYMTGGSGGRFRLLDFLYTAAVPGMSSGTTSTISTFSTTTVSVITVAGEAGLPWIPAENVFTAQEQLVTLLAVIAAIGMPIGAMTAIVFFGQAVISSGMSGQGASQVLVAIAAVVVILVSIQMFQQFAGFLGTAFDAVNGDRFVVFDESLGSLAETIAEFWGVLAFAGFINIAAIVWRNYSGNFSIGGNVGGL